MTADSTSVTQKACQTPVGPNWRQSSHASGMMKMTYRQREMTSEAAPLPRPSSAPEEVVDSLYETRDNGEIHLLFLGERLHRIEDAVMQRHPLEHVHRE